MTLTWFFKLTLKKLCVIFHGEVRSPDHKYMYILEQSYNKTE